MIWRKRNFQGSSPLFWFFHHAQSNRKGAWPLTLLARHQPSEPPAALQEPMGRHARYLPHHYQPSCSLPIIYQCCCSVRCYFRLQKGSLKQLGVWKSCFQDNSLCWVSLYFIMFLSKFQFNWLFPNLRPGFLSAYMTHSGRWLKCRIWFSRPRMGAESLRF